ncbi:MAG: apolipoprotein N-acyltransferase [Caulobacteraceae bacterium]|nr:apolipoprotein N-acyltransferase [Caulobacteraceae bacterium]
MSRPAERLGRGWPARGVALAAGIAAALAHPPFGILPGLLGYAALLWSLDAAAPARPLRSAFLRGWLAGLGYFAVGVFWVTEAFLVDAATYGWMAPFALVLLAGGLALFWGLAGVLYRLAVGRRRGALRVLVFAGALALAEWLRGNILTGFPWNLPGESWRAGSAVSQAAALVGAYGLSWLTIAIAAAPAVWLDAAPRARRLTTVGLAAAALAGLWTFGALRLADAAGPEPGAPRLRLVQANIDQKEKWRPENLEPIFATYLALSGRPSPTPPDVIVWPEGALPAVIDELVQPGSRHVRRLEGLLRPGQTLLIGANRVDWGRNGRLDYFNSLIAFQDSPRGLTIPALYDKHRLVPFGEFMPLGDFAAHIGFRSLVHMPEDFTAGPPPRPMRLAGLLTLQPLICYEALFPGLADGPRPRWLLNVSNDAWFGKTSGPLQHLNLASYRAIEAGLPMARVTPTGVTAMIDAYGRIAPGQRLGLGRYGVVDAPLPPALTQTPYARFGELAFWLMLLASGATALTVRLRQSAATQASPDGELGST